MDYRAASLAAAARGRAPAQAPDACDRAIFTSLRTSTGEGYRVVAASPGVRPNERAAIAQNVPSHGGLCSDDPETTGLCAFGLPTGRYSIAHSIYAGEEHTGRGGLRVYSHILLLQPEQYRQFGCNPFRAVAALQRAVGETPDLNPPASLESFSLSTLKGGGDNGGFAHFVPGEFDLVSLLLGAALRNEKTLIIGHDTPRALMRAALYALPQFARAKLELSIGLNYSPTRRALLSFVRQEASDLQRAVRGHKVTLLDAAALPAVPHSPLDGWLALARGWLERGRSAELEQLSAELAAPMTADDLSRLAGVCQDLDKAAAADEKLLKQMHGKYRKWPAKNEVERGRVQRLIATVEERLAQFAAAAASA